MGLRDLYDADARREYLDQFSARISKRSRALLLRLDCLHDCFIREIKIDYQRTSFANQRVDIWLYFRDYYDGDFYWMKCSKALEMHADFNYRSHQDAGNWIIALELSQAGSELTAELTMRDWAEVESTMRITAERIIIARDRPLPPFPASPSKPHDPEGAVG